MPEDFNLISVLSKVLNLKLKITVFFTENIYDCLRKAVLTKQELQKPSLLKLRKKVKHWIQYLREYLQNNTLQVLTMHAI